MIRHLTEDQITKWFADQSTTDERQHVHQCGDCAGRVRRFQDTLGWFQSAVSDRVERTFGAAPLMSAITQSHSSAGGTIFGNLVQRQSLAASLAPHWLSFALHVAFIALLLIPAAMANLTLPTATQVTMLVPLAPLLLPAAGRSSGGGGGGMRTPTPPSKGMPPRGTDKQLMPPMVEAKNFAPDLIIEPTIVAPSLAHLPQFSFLTIGDPNGVAGPPSAGPGSGGGIGTGDGRGVGPGKGPGTGNGEGGNAGGGPYNYSVGGGLTAPVMLSEVLPEYSDDARRARIQGTVELLAVVNADGTVSMENVNRSLGFGLDQKAIEAVKKWKFRPATKDGKPVAMRVAISVNFTLR